MNSGATISKDGIYRTLLWRRWIAHRPTLAVCMLNPSTADGKRNDPTILKIIWWAGAWGYGGVEVVNFCAYRATEPKLLFAAIRDGVDVVGPDNMATIANTVLGREVLCAWGAGVRWLPRDHVLKVEVILRKQAKRCLCVGTTQHGEPLHPLYIPKDTQPRPFAF